MGTGGERTVSWQGVSCGSGEGGNIWLQLKQINKLINSFKSYLKSSSSLAGSNSWLHAIASLPPVPVHELFLWQLIKRDQNGQKVNNRRKNRVTEYSRSVPAGWQGRWTTAGRGRASVKNGGEKKITETEGKTVITVCARTFEGACEVNSSARFWIQVSVYLWVLWATEKRN